MKIKLLLTLLLMASCSTNRGVGKPFQLEHNLDAIPDEFEQEKGTVVKSFVDKTKYYGLEGIKAYNFNIVDINGDGFSDIVAIPSFYAQPQFYLYDIHKHKFIKSRSPFAKTLKVSFLLFYDLNQDKIIDAITGVLNQETELSKQPLRVFYGSRDKNKNLILTENYKFKDSSPNTTVSLIDYNLDGKLDLFVGNWFKKVNGHPRPVADQLYLNQGKKFKNVSHLLLAESKQTVSKTMLVNASPTYGSQTCDMDQNGFPDIITTATNKFKNNLWMNRYKFREKYRYFENFGVVSGVAGDPEGVLNTQGSGRTFSVACADYNNDTIMDVFLGELSHNYDAEGIDKSSLLTGRSLKFPPRFYRTEYFLDHFETNWHQADRRAIWLDYNNDGLLDLIVDNSGYPPHTRLILFEQLADHSFVNKSKELGIDIINPISTVIADFNRDGKMDILTSQSKIRDETLESRVYLFENNLELAKKKSIRFYLRGKKSNTHGLNAMIILKIKNQKGFEYRRQNVSFSYGSLPPQNEEGVHFGINEGESIEKVIVRWPYSKSLNQTRAGLEVSYKVSIELADFMNITLCEDGQYLIGRRKCL
ncbi:MAG: CRTAC1 family protein [Halobacteriovoraceae bacterium]|nr:CRTAC1 family protein [Halobacteriovoraceae bacterium]